MCRAFGPLQVGRFNPKIRTMTFSLDLTADGTRDALRARAAPKSRR